MFRRLYWVVEQTDHKGHCTVTGVYTSIQDLVRVGLKWPEGSDSRDFRLYLVKPDSFNAPFGTWDRSSCVMLADDLQGFVETKEYTEDEVKLLVASLEGFLNATVG